MAIPEMKVLSVALVWAGFLSISYGEPETQGAEEFARPYYFDSSEKVVDTLTGEGFDEGEGGEARTAGFPWSADSLVLLRRFWNGVQNYSTFTEYSYLSSQWYVLRGNGLPQWTHMATDYEDSSSTHYYFYHSNGESVDRIRWVWNGGAQNPPEVVDYFLDAGSFQVIKSIGQRKSLPDLILGLDVPLRETEQGGLEGIVSNASTGYIKRSESQDLDLKIPVDLLSEDRSILGEKGPLK